MFKEEIKLISIVIKLYLLCACNNSIDLNYKSRAGSYSFGIPNKFAVSSSETITFNMNFVDGIQAFQKQYLEQISTASSKCEISVEDSESSSPSLTLSNCTGSGRITLKYGSASSLEFLVYNDLSNPYVFTSGIALSPNEETLYVSDIGNGTIFQVKISTGEKIILRSSSVGSGDNIPSPIDIEISSDGRTIYGIDSSINAVFSLDIETKTSTILSGASTGSGDVFTQVTRLIVDSNAQNAYVIERDRKSIYEVNLSSGARTKIAPAPYIQVSYGLTFGATENIIYYTDRESNFIYQVDVSTADPKVAIAENNIADTYNFNKSNSLLLDPIDNNSLYVLNWNGTDTLLKVNIATGEKTLVAEKNIVNGPSFGDTKEFAITSDGTTLYITDNEVDAIFSINLITGNRVLISK